MEVEDVFKIMNLKLVIGEREMGEGLEFCEKNNFEELSYKYGGVFEVEFFFREIISQLEFVLCELIKLFVQRDSEIFFLRNSLGVSFGECVSNVSVVLDEEVKRF